MYHNVPIRTYGRKNSKHLIVPLTRLHVPTASNINYKNCDSLTGEVNDTENKENDNSLYYDPLDTTFDRLVKNARVPMQIIKSNNNSSWSSSRDVSSSFNTFTPDKVNNKHSMKMFDKSDLDIMPIPKSKKGRPLKDKNMQVIKKTIFKNKKVIKNKVKKTYTLRKQKNKTTKAFKIKGHNNNSNNVQENNNKKKGTLQKNEMNDDILHLEKYGKSFKLKPCSIILNRFDVPIPCNNTSENNVSEEPQKNASRINKSIEECDFASKITNSKNNTLSIKQCFVKIDELNMFSYRKSVDKVHEYVISSTPIGRRIRHSTHLLTLSPIPTKHFKQLSVPLTRISTTSHSTQNRISSSPTFKEMRLDYECEHEISAEILKDPVNTLCDGSNSNVNQLKKLSDNSINPLTTFGDIENNVQDQQKHLMQEENAQITNDYSLDMFSSIKEDCIKIKNVKCPLNFSTDMDKSCSLFSRIEENVQSSNNDINAESKINVSASSVVSNKMYKEIPNEFSKETSIIIEKCKKSISSMNSSTAKITFNNGKEESNEILRYNASMVSNASYDEVYKLENNATNKENSFLRNTKHKEGYLSKTNILHISNSLIGNEKKCNVECNVILKRLQDPIRITGKRKRYKKWDIELSKVAILEDCNNSNKSKEGQNNFDKKNGGSSKIPNISLQVLESMPKTFVDTACIQEARPIFLKPGKSWVRSLSILSNIQNESCLERFSYGKGKKWRSSVRDILDMQKQGILQSCIKKNENDKDLQVIDESLNKSEHRLNFNQGEACDSTSLQRISSRISVCVVPINKSIKSIQDTSFLEAYGIIPVEKKRFTLVSDRRKSSLCSIKNDAVDGNVNENEIVSTAKQIILHKCMQKDYIQFSAYFSKSYLEHCRKIGEGVYGEVFLYEHEDQRSVIKIIPIEGSECVNGEPQKKFHEILSEIVIARELHNLRFNTKYNTDGFVEVKKINCVQGKYPQKFVDLWNVYDEEKQSDNDCPSMFNEDQLYIILELSHGGQDLEAFVFYTAEEAYSLFVQTALALAVAEKAMQFEHRDLHWGNILISTTNESYMCYELGKTQIKVPTKGVKVSIIDFTLSRVTYGGCNVFNNLATDPTLFTAQGEYQFEIYRLMRDKLMNDWQKFEPYTNILWLHYTLDKMITAVRYRKRNLKLHKNGIKKLKELKDEILMHDSAYDFVKHCDKISILLCNDSKTFVSTEE